MCPPSTALPTLLNLPSMPELNKDSDRITRETNFGCEKNNGPPKRAQKGLKTKFPNKKNAVFHCSLFFLKVNQREKSAPFRFYGGGRGQKKKLKPKTFP